MKTNSAKNLIMDTVLVSVVMAVYNGEKYLGAAISSILKQSYSNFEFIIVNDGSKDSSSNIINSFDDARIVNVYQENSGLAYSLNVGLNLAKGKYIARMDADDIAREGRLEMQVAFLEQNPNVVAVGSNADLIDASGSFICKTDVGGDNNVLKQKLPTTPFIHPSVMFRTSIAIEIGGYPNIRHGEDAIFFSLLSKKGDFFTISDSLIFYRIWPGALSRKSSKQRTILDKVVRNVIKSNGIVSESDYQQAASMTNTQSNKVRNYEYNLLLAKKYSWDNYQPQLVRKVIIESLKIRPFALMPLMLYLLSFLPKRLLRYIYLLFK
jgi:glycosyltransferase involved in cell wall biosynthesis